MSTPHRIQWLLLTAAIGVSNLEPLLAQEKPRVDLYGDPLPAGAIARLGTLQFRHATTETQPLAFSEDGKRLLSASSGDRTIRVWDAATGKQFRAIKFPAPDSYMPAMAFSAEGKSLALGGPSAADVYLWNSDREKPWSKTSLSGANRGLSLSQDGRLLAFNNYGRRTIRLWDTKEGKEFPRTFELPDDPYQALLSCDGKLLAASDRKVVLVWDVATGKELHRLPTDFRGVVRRAMAMSPDSKLLAAPNPSQQEPASSIALWDLTSGKKVYDLPCDMYYHTAFSPNGKWLAATGNKSIHIWDTGTGKEHRKLASGGYAPGYEPVFSPDSRTLAYRMGATIHLLDVETGKPFQHRPGHQVGVKTVAFSPDGKLLASAGPKEVIVWDVPASKQLHFLAGHESYVNCLAFSTDSKTLVTASNNDRTIRRWDVAGGKEISTITVPQGHRLADPLLSLPPHYFVLSHDRRTLVSVRGGPKGPDDATIQGWDLDSGKEMFHRSNVSDSILAEMLARGGKPMYSADLAKVFSKRVLRGPWAQSRDGRMIAGIDFLPESETKQIEETTVRETATGLELFRIPTGWASDMTFSPDGRLLLTSRPGTLMRIWDIATGKELLREAGPEKFEEHGAAWYFGSKLSFSPDGFRVATGHLDSTILIWDVSPARWKAEPVAPALDARELDSLWADLRGTDGRKVHAGLWNLVGGGKPALDLLKDRLTPTAEVDPKRIKKLVADLASGQFAVRDVADRELRAAGQQAEALLRASLEEPSSVETRRRVESVLASLEKIDSPDLLRRLRAIQALELIGTAQAKEILESVSRGAARARETREAQAALQRLGQRKVAAPSR